MDALVVCMGAQPRAKMSAKGWIVIELSMWALGESLGSRSGYSLQLRLQIVISKQIAQPDGGAALGEGLRREVDRDISGKRSQFATGSRSQLLRLRSRLDIAICDLKL